MFCCHRNDMHLTASALTKHACTIECLAKSVSNPNQEKKNKTKNPLAICRHALMPNPEMKNTQQQEKPTPKMFKEHKTCDARFRQISTFRPPTANKPKHDIRLNMYDLCVCGANARRL